MAPAHPGRRRRAHGRLRASGADPWEYDLLLTDVTPSTWTYKPDARIALPLDRALWTRDGVPYLRPQVQVLLKAPGLREKDQADFDVTLPLLDAEARAWLRSSLDLGHPGHPWSRALRRQISVRR